MLSANLKMEPLAELDWDDFDDSPINRWVAEQVALSPPYIIDTVTRREKCVPCGRYDQTHDPHCYVGIALKQFRRFRTTP